MKFTPEQVIEMAREAGAVPTSKDYVGGAAGWFLSPEDLTRLCTLAADRAIEAAAVECDGVYHQHIGPQYGEVRYGIAVCTTAIRAMKEQQ